MLTALTNSTIFTGDEKITGKILIIKDDIIDSLIDPSELPESAKVIDLGGQSIAPGMIDLQIYGAGGKLFGGIPTVDALQRMEEVLLSEGCTGFMAAVATNSDAIVEQAIESARTYRKKALGNFIGLHLEGPYLNPICKGAHPEKFIKKGTLAEIRKWVEMADGEIKMMTIAPELQDQEVINYLYDQGVVISAGHSNSTYDEAIAFLNNPIQAATHLYNAMSKIHHREPGLVPAIFEMRPYTSIVADGIHVSFPMIELAKRELGDKLFLITDAVTEASEGAYRHVFAGDRFTMPDGTLSGSCLTMLKAVENCVKYVGISLHEALKMGSLYPATLAGQSNSIGRIHPGHKANLVTFNNDYKAQHIFLNGKMYEGKA